jgi:hypothetical protein
MDINLKNNFLSLQELHNSNATTQEKLSKKKQVFKELVK